VEIVWGKPGHMLHDLRNNNHKLSKSYEHGPESFLRR